MSSLDHDLVWMTSCYSLWWWCVQAGWYIDQLVLYAVHHDELGLLSAHLQCLPAKLLKHCRWAAVWAEVAIDVSGGSTLHHFQLIDVSLCVRCPNCWGILQLWSDVGFVAVFFYQTCQSSGKILRSQDFLSDLRIFSGFKKISGFVYFKPFSKK